MHTVDAKYDDVSIIALPGAPNVALVGLDSIVDAHRNMSIKLVRPTMVIVTMAANRRSKWMSLKRLLILMTLSEKY